MFQGCPSVCPSHSCERDISRNTIREFLQIWHECPLKDEVIDKAHCVLRAHISGPDSNNDVTFCIQKARGQLHCDIVICCKRTFGYYSMVKLRTSISTGVWRRTTLRGSNSSSSSMHIVLQLILSPIVLCGALFCMLHRMSALNE